jgi:hypothetical protein
VSPYLKKITKTKRPGGMAQVVEHLPVKCKTLSLNNKKEELLTTYLQ